jgi:tetratricopeptide (TPR) repeat protein
MSWFRSRQVLLPAAILLAVLAAYFNHWDNSFHFDDSHAVVDNPYIRSLRNVPRFFTDATTFSVLPANRTYRPMVSASLAFDYAMGHGYNSFWFHLSTFVVFLAQLVAMYAVFVTIANAARPGPDAMGLNRNVSLLAVAWYGLHPAMAETVNYIIQRGDVFCACGVAAALAVYARWPARRKTGLYLLPFVFALLSKPPAVVFPVLLFLYIAMFERERKGRYAKAALGALPSALVCALLMVLQSAMTPKTYTPATGSGYAYVITQPLVLARYFGALFLPLHLNVDTDLEPFASLTAKAISGFLFVALLLVAAWATARPRTLRPISFGLLWFLIASLPTSLYRLSEVENDHRMYMPFVGLVLAVAWAAFLLVDRVATGARRTAVLRTAAVGAAVLLAAYAYGTHVRNQVWSTDDSLWLDDVNKSPHNGRGLMNYGLTLMARGDYPVALVYFERALLYTPNYETLEINLGVVNGAMNRGAEAERHFQRAIALAPADDEAHYFYGRWLFQTGRTADAVRQLEMAVELNPARISERDLLAKAYAAMGESERARATAAETLRLDAGDATATAMAAGGEPRSAEDWLNASLKDNQEGKYEESIADARKALKLRPDYAEAYNNIAAGCSSLGRWDEAIAAATEAIRLKPDFQLAKNNLAWAISKKKAGAR